MDQIQQVAERFGVDWIHLGAQMISFGIMCAVLYRLAYGPILKMLETRRQQIAAGLANADRIKTELQRIEAQRLQVLEKAGDEGRQLVEDARVAAARVGAEERRKATAEAAQIVANAREAAEHERAHLLAEARQQVARLVIQTAASVTGKILTADDHKRLAEETASRLAAV
jgi:F-type H+-transporting ATPase subunit b